MTGVFSMRVLLSAALLLGSACTLLAEEIRLTKPERIIKLPGDMSDRALAPEGKAVALATLKGPMTLWDVATGNKLQEFEGLDNVCSRIAFSQDGSLLVGGG